MEYEFIDRGAAETVAALASASPAAARINFEWQTTLEEAGVNALLLKDEERTWWHSCIDDVLLLLDKYKPSKLIGSSMGGYGALLFAQLTGIPARALSPQTTISANDWDNRYEQWWVPIRKATKRPDLLDLTISGDQHHIHYCAKQGIARRHAERLAVRLIPYNCESYKVSHFIEDKTAIL